MKLENSFTVAAPLEKTWETLLDIERVATCLPGATIESGGSDGVYHGKMKMKLGPMVVDYRGTARFQDIDEDEHVASIAVQAREAKGQGTAAAVISNSLEPTPDGGTKVTAVTDLKITGRQAQFGRGIMQDVAGSMMEQFAQRLEKEILSGASKEPAATAASSAGQAEQSESDRPAAAAAAADEDVLDVGDVLSNLPLAKYAAPAAAALAGILLLIVLLAGAGRRKRTININLKH